MRKSEKKGGGGRREKGKLREKGKKVHKKGKNIIIGDNQVHEGFIGASKEKNRWKEVYQVLGT